MSRFDFLQTVDHTNGKRYKVIEDYDGEHVLVASAATVIQGGVTPTMLVKGDDLTEATYK